MNLRIFGGFDIRMQFFLLTPLFEYYLREYMCKGSWGGPNATPLYVATPTFKATPTRILACFSGFLHTHPSIDQELALWGFKGTRPLWVWPWGRDLCGRGHISLCSIGPCPQRSRPLQGHAHKGLGPLEHQKANSRSIDAKIHSNHAKTILAWL